MESKKHVMHTQFLEKVNEAKNIHVPIPSTPGPLLVMVKITQSILPIQCTVY